MKKEDLKTLLDAIEDNISYENYIVAKYYIEELYEEDNNEKLIILLNTLIKFIKRYLVN